MKQPPDSPPRKNVLPELIIPVLAMLFAIYYLTTITDVPWIAQASAMLVSVLLLLSVVAFAIRTVYRVRKGTEYLGLSDSLGELDSHRAVNLKRVLLFVLSVLYVFFLPVVGFSVATFVLIFGGILILSDETKSLTLSAANVFRAFIVAFVCTVVGYIAFIQLFKTRFPFGPIENLLKDWSQ